MSVEDYLISKSEREFEEIWKGRDEAANPAIGHFLMPGVGAGAAGAITAPKGKKGRAALGAGTGSLIGMTPGTALAMRAARAKRPGLALAGNVAGLMGGMYGASGGYRLAVGPKAKKLTPKKAES